MSDERTHRPRNIIAQLHRRRECLWQRNYVAPINAMRRGAELLILTGQPGDVIQISHAEFGFEIAVIKLHVGGKMSLTWTLEGMNKGNEDGQADAS